MLADVEGIEPEDLRLYLADHDWVPDDAATWSTDVEYWVRPTGDEVLVPLRRSFRDYLPLLAEAVEGIAQLESRDPVLVAREVAGTSYDTLRFRAPTVDRPDSLPLDVAIEVVSNAREALYVSARATIKPRARYGGGHAPLLADEYMRRVHLAHTEHGSFVVAVRSPLTTLQRTPRGTAEVVPDTAISAEPVQATSPQHERPTKSELAAADVATDEDRPREVKRSVQLLRPRDVVGTFVRAVHDAENAARMYIANKDLTVFDNVVANGVNANLCEALASIKKAAPTSVSLTVAWSPRVELVDVLRSLPSVQSLTSDTAHVFERAAEYLARPPKRDPAEVIGQVIELRRRGTNQPGRVQVRGMVEGRLRSVFVSLGISDYQTAVAAHGEGRRVRVVGVFRPSRRILLVDAPEKFEIFDQ